MSEAEFDGKTCCFSGAGPEFLFKLLPGSRERRAKR